MIRIHSDFECGNIRVLKIEGDNVYLQNEMRGTKRESYYYWAFCVEGANGRTLNFHLDKEWVGPYGAAVSKDLIDWGWSETATGEDSFTYCFGEDDDVVYFAHDLVYTPKRLFSVLSELDLTPDTLCMSLGGRDVPCVKIGNGEKHILVSSRHHCCESSGSYVLEGMLREYIAKPMDNTTLFVVPIVDLDGVVLGEQGKDRAPYDHNRDYVEDSMYPEVAAIKQYADENEVSFAFDFHAPSHKIGRSNHIFVVRKMPELTERFDRFGGLFEEYSGGDAMDYFMKNDIYPNTGWNKDETPTFSSFFNNRPECRLALTLEVTHYGTDDNKLTRDRLINTGRAFYRALVKFSEMDCAYDI